MKADFQLRRLCLNMIVKNEAHCIERCLRSVAPYISSYAILDTGSTDGTPGLINRYFSQFDIKGTVEIAEFVDFSQARNAALEMGRAILRNKGHIMPYADQFLLMDADMELVVEDPEAFHNLRGEAYRMVQQAGAVSYPNTRLLSVKSDAKYVGVTHEYLDVEAVDLVGAHFIDHANGSNRVDKFKRDIRLLNSALAKEPENGRYWYYLGQSHRDAGDPKRAAECYRRRVELGGWDEEVWSAQLNYATCLKDQHIEGAFIENALKAYNMRPRRAETLYDLARHFRLKGDNVTALLFAKAGMAIPKPDDWLFVNQFVYEYGFKEEYSITAFYDERERPQGAVVNDDLSNDVMAPAWLRSTARNNQYWYLKSLEDYAPTFKQAKLDFQPPHAGYTPMNPSITTFEGQMLCNIRCVNYRMDSEGRYLINGTDGEANATNPIDTRNFVVQIDPDLKILGYAQEIVWPRPAPLFNLVTGMEDVRLYRDGNDLCASACVREQNEGGVCQQIRYRLDYDAEQWNVVSWSKMSDTATHEKNWMPARDGRAFMYRLDRVLETPPPAKPEIKHELNLAVDDISGGSQLVPFKNGWLAVVHERQFIPGTQRRFYWHRFAWFNADLRLMRISRPFYFQDKQIEFCAGLTEHPDGNSMVLSYGIRDCEAWLGQISITDIALMLVDVNAS